MSDITVGLLAICILMALFLTGIELGFAMAFIGFLGYAYVGSITGACNILVKDFFETFSAYGFTVVPVFLLMGQIAYNSGSARKLFDSAAKFSGHVPGALGMTTVVGATLFKSMCGSTLATVSTVASIAVPEMRRHGYSKSLSTGVVAAVGAIGNVFPPSINLIIFGIITEQSIGQLFMAGIVPGLVICCFFLVTVYVWAKAYPSAAPMGEHFSWGQRIRALPELLWAAVVFAVVIGGLMKGFFTPTEAGTIGTVTVLIIAITKEHFSLKNFIKSVDESLRTACMVLMLIAGSTVLGHFIAITEIPLILADWTAGLPLHKNLIMVLIMFIYLIGGSFIDDMAFMILATPIFYPVILKLGYDPIWFGIMIGMTVMIGCIIPPVAMTVFVVKAITREDFSVIYRGVYPFLVGLVLMAILLFIVPEIATFLPRLFSVR